MDLIEAVEQNNINLVKDLLFQFKVKPDLQTKDGWTALIEASWYGRIECIQVLLQAGANTDLQTNSGCTALIYATRKGNTEYVKLLLNEYKANPNIQTNNGLTPLIWASCHGLTECLRALLNAGANTNIKDVYGYTALMYASESSIENHTKIVKILKRMYIVQILNDY